MFFGVSLQAQTIPLTPERTSHAASLLPSGKVLITGGANEAATLNSALLYDPAAGDITPTGNMTSARADGPSSADVAGLIALRKVRETNDRANLKGAAR